MSSLTDIAGIAGGVAKHLRDEYGIETIEDLGEANPDEVSVPTGNAEALIRRARQRSISSQNAADLLNDYNEMTYAPTGVDLLDEVMGGGWEAETIGMVYGKSGRGKTQLVFSSMAEVASSGGSVVYLQTEMQSKSVAERLDNLAESTDALKNITFYEAYSVDEQYDIYEKVEEEHHDVDLFVIDSFTAQFRMTDEFDDRSTLSARSSELGRHLRTIGEMSRKHSFPVVMTGQVYPSPEAYGKGDNLWGGEKLKHFVSFFVRMSSGQGELVKATLENHPGRSEDEVLINITDTELGGVEQ